MQVGNAGLRNWDQTLLLSFPAKVFWNQSLGHIVLEPFAKALFDDRSRHVPGAKARQPRALLVSLNLQFGLAHNFRGRNLDRNLPLDIFFCVFGFGCVGSLCGAHVLPFPNRWIRGPSSKRNRTDSYGVHLSVKTEGE